MARKGKCKIKRMATARANLPTSIINWRRSLVRDHLKQFISEHIHGLIPIFNVSFCKGERAWDLFYDIIILDPVTTHHSWQFQLILLHWSRSRSHFGEWWADFGSYMGQMFDKTRHQMNNWRWDNPPALGDLVDHPNLRRATLGKI